jgi:two-component system, cell cycle sensor histidine kinase and response regulator CckA
MSQDFLHSDHQRSLVDDQILERETEEEYTASSPLKTPIPVGIDRKLARLIVLVGDKVGRRFVLKSRSLIGRSQSATIQLVDTHASRRHAELRPHGKGGFEIVDLGSRNGTVVNGKPIDKQILRYGDRICIGEHVLLYTHHDPLQEQVFLRQRLEAVGRLGAGIAHDFNNLLGAITATMDYLESIPSDRTLEDPDVRSCLDDILAATKRSTELTRRLLVYSRQGRAEHTEVDVSNLCVEVSELLRRTTPHSIELKVDVQPKLLVRGHAGELHQVLMNLALNARDAMASGGVLTISAKRTSPDQVEGPLFIDDSFIVLSIEDTGRGIDEETLQHIFEPFYSTKRGGVSAGLGLATSYEIVTAHGGEITVKTALGEGSTFCVYLPRLDASTKQKRFRATTAQIERPDRETRRAAEGVLIVDDEALIRRSLGRLLTRSGYIVSIAKDGEEALQIFAKERERLSAIVLDIDMPRLDGVSTLARIRESSRDIAVICISGHHDDETEARLRALGALRFLQKPIDFKELERLIAWSTGRGSPPPLPR